MHADWILVVDDEALVRRSIVRVLGRHGFETREADTAEAALDLLDDEAPPAVAFIDIVLPGLDGLELVARIRELSPTTECVVMTAHGTLDTAVRAIRDGAFDYLQKPFDDLREIATTAERGRERRDLTLANRSLLMERGTHNVSLARSLDRLRAVDRISRRMSELSATDDLLDYFAASIAESLGVDRDRVSIELDVDRSARSRGSFTVPLWSNRRVLGVVTVVDADASGELDEEARHFVVALANHLAVDIERTRYVEALEAANRSLRETRERLVFAERLEATGQLAAGIAHDFNNTLSVVLARSQMILQRLDAGALDVEPLRANAAAIADAASAGAETIRRLQEVTRIRRDAPVGGVDLDRVVSRALEAEELADVRLRRDVELVVERGGVGPIAGNAPELTQVVTHLAVNALEAMPSGGVLRVATGEEHGRAVLTISDTGTGMDEDVRSKLFQPFFSTKIDGRGLGTSIVYGIVSRHGGAIAVSSAPGAGSTFRLDFPLSTAVPEPVDGPVGDAAAMPPSAGVRVLLCDDDPMVRDVFEEALGCGGHDVVCAANGDEAIERFEAGTFDLVVTDLSMPGRSGFDVARHVKGTERAVPVVLLSGWSIQHDDAEVREAGIDRVLVKPCAVTALLDTVAELAAQETPGSTR